MKQPPTPKILIVDDHPENIRVLMDALGEDHQVIVAKDGEKAIDRAFRFQPDIILLDIMMPGMDGFEVCRILKNDEKTKTIPVIFVTAMDDVRDEEKGLRLGAIDYIRKPFHPAVARIRIRNHLLLKRRTDLLEDMVRLDGLTEIHNRRGFDEALDREWKTAKRDGSDISLVLLDIDHFKQYNDHYGHGRGDECLIAVARIIVGCAKRPRDFVARYGGEEFAVLAPGAPVEGALVMAENIRGEVESAAIPHISSPIAGHVTVSLGVAARVNDEDASSTLVARADQALYRAKASGRNRVMT